MDCAVPSNTLPPSAAGDIVTLFKFVFEEVDSEEFEVIGDIKDLLGDYALWNVESLMRDANFWFVLNGMPSLEKGLFRWMWK